MITGGEGDEDCFPAQMGEGIDQYGQDVDDGEDQAQEGEKVVHLAIDQARPAGRLQVQTERKADDDGERQKHIGGDAARPRNVPNNGIP